MLLWFCQDAQMLQRIYEGGKVIKKRQKLRQTNKAFQMMLWMLTLPC